jgi:DNA repair protein RecO (recombination protein O)
MPLERADGLVLRTRPLTETSLIVHWLCPDLGRLATVAKGARRPKSPFRGKLDLFFEARFAFHRSRRSDLHVLREVLVVNPHPGLRLDYGRLRRAAYAAVLVEQVTETETPLPGLYALLADFLGYLSGAASPPAAVLAFEAKLLDELGLAPDPATAHLSPAARQTLDALTRLPFSVLGVATPTAEAVGEVDRFLAGFMTYHLDRVPRGRAQAIAGVH